MLEKFREFKKPIQWFLAALCLVYLVHFFGKNTEDLKLVLGLNLSDIGLIVFFCVLGHVIYSFRFGLILTKCSGKSIPFFKLFRMVTLNNFLSTYASQAGNIYQSVALKKNYQISYTEYIGAVFSIIWLDTCFNFVFGIIIVLTINPNLQIGIFTAWHLLLCLLVLVGLAPIVAELIFSRITFRNKFLGWIHGRLSEMLKLSTNTLTDKAFLLKIFLTGLVALANAVTIFYICFRALGIQAQLPVLTLFYIIMKLCNRVIITPGNLGIREIAYGILSSQMHIGMAHGILVSAVMRTIGTIVISILGIALGGITLLKQQPDNQSESQGSGQQDQSQ